MTFEQDRQKMLDFYFETERQFIDLSRVIPLDNLPDTYSPIFYNILQSSCGQVESMLRLICERFQLSPSAKSFPAYYGLLNQNGVLQRQIVSMNKGEKLLNPFSLPAGDITPTWWKAYNQTK